MDVQDMLKRHGLKKTPTRTMVLDVFHDTNHALAIADLENELGSNVDRVTLYRTMSSFEEKGLIHKVHDDEGKLKYSLCSHACSEDTHHDNHLHFHCRNCNKTICIERVPVPDVEGLNGYEIHDVYMVANGVCKACKAEA